MLKLNSCHPDKIINRGIASGFSVGAEGAPLISAIENNVEVIKPSTGASGEKFAGFSWKHNILPSVVSTVETVTVPASSPYTVSLKYGNLLAGQIHVEGKTEHADTPADDVYVANDTTGVITFHSADASEELTVTYRRSPSTLEAKYLYPDADVNINPAFEILNNLGVVQAGEVYTDQFDASIDWATGGDIKLGAGVLTIGGTGTTLSAKITHVPSADVPFLGLTFSVH